ncbi:rhamnogalacturonan acetylesterase [Arthrobacter sp. N199823]|uniref:rhamnogalacturonan acetylesterase n=1 Tax=Arthrobacter sp. N199823 TaxID=2058895 RepID=UPI000CE491D2|nr:rhamnogalacturonan acetylesterase [Arthrobacter sp. N199823]
MKILLAGDSTVANCPTEEFPMSGWGAHLAPHVHAWAAVHNFAKGGATTESFREEGLWQALLETAEAGDMVLVQFGHNDQKQQHLAAGAGYSVNLHRMIREIRSLGASPILCTSVERRNFHKGVPVATLADYADAVGSVAEDMGVPVIDLHDWTSKLYAAAGEDGSAAYFTQFEPGTHAHWPEGIEDNTHFNQQGALLIAGFVAERVLELRDGVSEAK